MIRLSGQPAPRIPVAALIVILGVAVLAVLARIATQAILGFYRGPETWEEGYVALDLAAGRGYGHMDLGTWQVGFRAPVYPLLLGAAYAVLGSSPVVAGLFNALLGGATAAAAAVLASRLGGSLGGITAGVLVAAHPGLLVYSAKIHQLSLDALLMVAAPLIVITALDRPNIRSSLAMGMTGAALALSRATAIPFVAFAALIVPLRGWSVRSVQWSALVLAIVAVASAGWLARTWIATGEPTLTTNTGLFLWIGNNPNATGTGVLADGRAVYDADPALLARVYGKDEAEQDRIFREAALSYIAADPARAARNVVARFGSFWWFTPTIGLSYPRSWLLAYAVYYVVLSGAAVVGSALLAYRGRGDHLATIVALLVIVAGAQSLFYVETRHRWAVEPLLVVLAAVAVTDPALLSRLGIRRR